MERVEWIGTDVPLDYFENYVENHQVQAKYSTVTNQRENVI